MDLNLHKEVNNTETKMRLEIESLKNQHKNTQSLYREVCVLLFFRYGITPTANGLYQYVKKGSMSAPAEALSKFWLDLRDKSRVRIDGVDLPDDLKQSLSEFAGAIWQKAQHLAQESLAEIRSESQLSAIEHEKLAHAASASLKDLKEEYLKKINECDQLKNKLDNIEKKYKDESSIRSNLDFKLNEAQNLISELKKNNEVIHLSFTDELEKLRSSLKKTEDQYYKIEDRLNLEIKQSSESVATLTHKLDSEMKVSREYQQEIHKLLNKNLKLQETISLVTKEKALIEGEMRGSNQEKKSIIESLKKELISERQFSEKIRNKAMLQKSKKLKVESASSRKSKKR